MHEPIPIIVAMRPAPLETGGCFIQVILHKVSTTETRTSDPNRGMADFKVTTMGGFFMTLHNCTVGGYIQRTLQTRGRHLLGTVLYRC